MSMMTDRPLEEIKFGNVTDGYYEPSYRIDGLTIDGGFTLFYAEAKAGKSTLVVNYARSLLTGERFLGRFETRPVDGTIVVLVGEMNPQQFDGWLHNAGLDDVGRVHLRGRCYQLDIQDDDYRAHWVKEFIRLNTKHVILDTLGSAYDALGIDESSNRQVGAYLAAWRELLQEAGVPEFTAVHHAGNAKNRTRGATKHLDMPDSVLKLTRSAKTGVRKFSADGGRDVRLLGSLQLDYDDKTGLYSAVGKTGPKDAVSASASGVLRYVTSDWQPTKAIAGKTALSSRQVLNLLRELEASWLVVSQGEKPVFWKTP